MRSASGPAPAATTTAVVESIVNVSAGDICTDDGIGTIACAGRVTTTGDAAGAGAGAVTGVRRPQAIVTNATPSTTARDIAELRTTIFTSICYFGVSPAAS